MLRLGLSRSWHVLFHDLMSRRSTLSRSEVAIMMGFNHNRIPTTVMIDDLVIISLIINLSEATLVIYK